MGKVLGVARANRDEKNSKLKTISSKLRGVLTNKNVNLFEQTSSFLRSETVPIVNHLKHIKCACSGRSFTLSSDFKLVEYVRFSLLLTVSLVKSNILSEYYEQDKECKLKRKISKFKKLICG